MLTVPVEQGERVVESVTLLLIETYQTIRPLLQSWFPNEYTLSAVDNCADTLTALCEQHPDLILLDTALPQSLEVLRAIRSRSDLPVILITSPDASSLTVKGLQLGANDYLTSPLDANSVRARVTTQLALKHGWCAHQPTIAQLNHTQEIQQNFTRMLSHDLKGPLTNIGMVQFMLRDMLQDNGEVSSVLDNLDVTLTGLTEIIRVFLEAMESQQLKPLLETFDVHDVIARVMEQHRLTAERKEIRLTMRNCQQMTLADARLLRQTLSNLVSNALKFSPAGTETSIWAESDGANVRINVADGGPGIPAAERNKLFSMFGKLSIHPTGAESSTGLGLWIVKQLTELQGGRVGVDQPADGGSVFWIELPGA